MATPTDDSPNDWRTVAATDFSSGLPDWLEPGFGWGRRANYSDGYAADANVWVDNEQLVLDITTDDGPDGRKNYSAGVVHSKGNVEFGPGTYLECRIKMNDVPGCNQAFWCKTSRNPPEWPPEIDFFETPMHDPESVQDTMHHIHWSGSGEVGDSSTHNDFNNGSVDHGRDLAQSWITIGCLWTENEIAHYADGELVGRTTQDDILRSVNNGAPHYLMLSQAVDLGWIDSNTPSDLSGYKTTNEIDYVQVYEYDPGNGDAGGDSTQETDAGGTPIPDDGEQYVWMRSGDGNEASLMFDAPAIEYDGSEPGYGVSSQPDGDGQRGEMETSKTSDLPGMIATGDGGIEAMAASSNADVFVSDSPVNPADYPDPPEPRRIEVRRADGSSGGVSYIIETDGDVTVARGGDDADGSKAHGVVLGGTDRYDLTDGSIVDVSTFGGEIVVTVDGSTV